MAKAIGWVARFDTIPGDAGKLRASIPWAIAGSAVNGVVNFAIDFSKTATANQAAAKAAIIADIQYNGGPTLQASDVLLWGSPN